MSRRDTDIGRRELVEPGFEGSTWDPEAETERLAGMALGPTRDSAEVDAARAETAVGDGATAGSPPALPSTLERGANLDRFLVVGKVGAGGMGVVVSAYDPDLDRKVAIKVLRSDRPEREASGRGQLRLIREAQAMAKLAHPNVITVYEVGTVGDQVFVAMEYVEGQTLARWLDETERSWRDVVEMFAQAGRGLAAAHRAGLVHRDFKPDNVLIDKDGRARVTDFGLVSSAAVEAEPVANTEVSSAAEPKLGSSTPLSVSLTRTGALLGTPRYMAPEQHDGEAVGDATDQFAFCVALYDALYKAPPFAGADYKSLARNVCRERLSPAPSDSRVPSWLHAVLVRGLRAEPARRHASMDALLDALARDPAATRKRWLAVAAGLGLAGATALMVFASAREASAPQPCAGAEEELGAVWDARARQAVDKSFAASGRPYAADTFARVDALMDGHVARWIDMYTEACEATHVRGKQSERLLDLRMRCLDRRREEMGALATLFAGEPDGNLVDRSVRAVLELSPIDACADADALSAAFPPPHDPALRDRVAELERRLEQAEAGRKAGAYKESLVIAAEVADQAAEVDHPPLIAEALLLLGSLHSRVGDPKKAEPILQRAAEAGALARADRVVARAWLEILHLAEGHAEANRLEPVARTAVVRAGNPTALRTQLLVSLGNSLYKRGRYEEALGYQERALRLRVELHGEDSLIVASSMSNLGVIHSKLGNFIESERYHTRALASREAALGPEHPDVANTLNNLGVLLKNQGRYQEADERLLRALAIREQAHGRDHRRVAAVCTNLGATAFRSGRLDDARGYHQRALEISEKVYGPEHSSTAISLLNLGLVADTSGQFAEARDYYQRALAIWEARLGGSHPNVATCLSNLGLAYQHDKRYADAQPHLERALAIYEEVLGAEHPHVANTLKHLGVNLLHRRQYREAERQLERALEIVEAAGGDPYYLADVRFALARVLWASRRDRERAIALARSAREALVAVGEGAAGADVEVDAWLRARGVGHR